jgi:hypothetical protein
MDDNRNDIEAAIHAKAAADAEAMARMTGDNFGEFEPLFVGDEYAEDAADESQDDQQFEGDGFELPQLDGFGELADQLVQASQTSVDIVSQQIINNSPEFKQPSNIQRVIPDKVSRPTATNQTARPAKPGASVRKMSRGDAARKIAGITRETPTTAPASSAQETASTEKAPSPAQPQEQDRSDATGNKPVSSNAQAGPPKSRSAAPFLSRGTASFINVQGSDRLATDEETGAGDRRGAFDLGNAVEAADDAAQTSSDLMRQFADILIDHDLALREIQQLLKNSIGI